MLMNHTHTAGAGNNGSLVRPAPAILDSVRGMMAAWLDRRRRREIRASAALEDRLLADIGVTREDVARGKLFWNEYARRHLK